MIVVTSTSVRCWSVAGGSNAAAIGIVWSDTGASAATTCSGGAKTCVFETAATEIASSATPGRADGAEAELVAVVACGDDGTTPARATFPTASRMGSAAGSLIAPPPEKLITSIPSCTAASNASMISAAFAT